jgi:6-phospho-beta-glucosidase
MEGLKIGVVGSGSTYSPELMEGIIKRKKSLPVKEIVLMDIDDRKLKIVGELCQRMIKAADMDCNVILTKDLDTALDGADFVLAQIRVGKLPARVLDEKIPLKYDLIGQETTGIGGFFKALRTIPELIKIANRMTELCPNAWLINFSNPSGIIAQALLNYTDVKMMGLCNVPINMKLSVEKKLGITDAEIEYVGLNHLSWITGIKKDGKDYLKDALVQGINSDAMKNIPSSGFDTELIQTVGAIPNSYLEYYYFKNKKLKMLKEAEKCRGEVCMDIEEQLLSIYSDNELHVKPDLLNKRGGAMYSEAAISLVDAIYNDKQEVHVVNILNNGSLDFMEDSDVVEISAVIGKDGPKPIKIENFQNQHIMELMRTVKAYERHTVEAAIKGDEKEAMRALLINPLLGDYNTSKACFEELKEAHKKYLPQFK